MIELVIRDIYDYALTHGGEMPEQWSLSPDQINAIRAEWHTSIYATQGGTTMLDGILKIVGVPIKVIPFADDPLFKQLKAMAVLASKEITFIEYNGRIDGASFGDDTGCWVYRPAGASNLLGGPAAHSALFQLAPLKGIGPRPFSL